MAEEGASQLPRPAGDTVRGALPYGGGEPGEENPCYTWGQVASLPTMCLSFLTSVSFDPGCLRVRVSGYGAQPPTPQCRWRGGTAGWQANLGEACPKQEGSGGRGPGSWGPCPVTGLGVLRPEESGRKEPVTRLSSDGLPSPHPNPLLEGVSPAQGTGTRCQRSVHMVYLP